MKILLTGEPGIGKSTIVQKILSAYEHPYFGVIAKEMRESGERVGFEVHSLHSEIEPRILAHKHEFTSDQKVADFFVDISVVDNFVIPLLREGLTQKGLSVCDEIGRMQSLSLNFIECLTEIIEKDSHFLGTIVKDDEPWSMPFKNHPDIYLFNVSMDNRDRIHSDLVYLMNHMRDRETALSLHGVKSEVIEYVNSGQSTQLKKLIENAIPYVRDGRVEKLDSANFLVRGFTREHTVQMRDGQYTCDCDLFNGLGGYEAGECSHVQSVRLDSKSGLILQYGLAVDIDETVSATAHNWIELITEQFGREAPEDLGLSANEMFEKYGLVQNVPYWQTDKVRDWIKVANVDPELTLKHGLMEGAHEGLWSVNGLIPIKYFWSARCESLAESTAMWMKNLDLPEAELLLKPEQISFADANQWKVDTIVDLFPYVSGVIDNSGDVVSRFPSDYKGVIFHYSAVEAVREDINVIPCANWNELARAVEVEIARGRLTPNTLEP